MVKRHSYLFSIFLLGSVQIAMGQESIQDNSFLVEEAYNQETGVVQHISVFSRMWDSKDWNYSFTQEWPGPNNWRHQFSYTLVGAHAGAFEGSGAGIGDVILNYRYQLVGNGESRIALAPRLSMLFPTGDVTKGRSQGGTGIQTNLPVSVELTHRLVAHTNAGATFIPHAQGTDQSQAASVGFNLGQSLIYLVHPRFNLMLEAAASNFQSIEDGKTRWSRTRYLSPGARWAFNFKNGLQIVPGVAMPIGVACSKGEKGLVVYLSFEHPFSKNAE